MGKDSYALDEPPANGDVAKQDGEVNYADDENKERGNWTGKLDFLLSAIGFAVGLGNVWRFPYIAYKNGGATFLIPYCVMLVTAGLPLFFLEMALGQFSSEGPISVWKVVPFFKGIGYAMVIISGLVCIYYNLIIAYTIYYFFASFTSKLPWSECRDEWVEMYNCKERAPAVNTSAYFLGMYCDDLKDRNMTNLTEYTANCTGFKTPSEIYWERVVLDISDGIDDGASEFKWQLVLCLLFAWLVIFVCLIRGIKSSGKVVYFTATFPYIVLICLLVRNALLEGAIVGIKFYVIPKWERLADADVWYSAATQIFYSLGVAFGGLETMASYNRFHNNIYRDAVIVAVLNCATSVFAGFVIFSVLGYMSVQTGVPVEDVASSGPGLAFIAYPEGLSLMPVSPLWSILFFFMLFTLGLDSQFAMMETVITALTDEFPVFKGKKRKILLTGGICLGMFLVGLPQCARNGIYIMNLFDWYSAGFSLIIVSLLEIIAIIWVYGWRRFSSDIEMMIGHKPNPYWLATWLVLTPGMLCFIIIFMCVSYGSVTYNDYVYPAWADAIGWVFVGLALMFVPLLALIEYCKAHGFIDTMRKVFQPRDDWGPALDMHRTGRYNGEDNKAFANDINGIDSNGINKY